MMRWRVFLMLLLVSYSGWASAVNLLAHYQFEQSAWNSAHSVTDSSGNGNNGSPVGNVSPLLPSYQKACQVLDVPDNSSNGQLTGVNSDLSVNQIGMQGTISFWYYSNHGWKNNGIRTLFDGTGADGRYFTLVIDGAGVLHFIMQDSNGHYLWHYSDPQNIAAGQWSHIAVTWDVAQRQMQLYINGRQVTSYTSVNGTFDNSSMVTYGTLLIGGNRTNLYLHNVYYQIWSADGWFDEVHIYQGVQTASDIVADKDNLTVCATPPTHFYQFELSQWTDNGAVVDEGTLPVNGTAVGNASPALPHQQKSCKALNINDNITQLDGVNSNVDINSIGNQGTISFWYYNRQPWLSGTNRTLFDASSGRYGPYFILFIDPYGRLNFVIQDFNGRTLWASSAAQYVDGDSWTHIAVTWDVNQRALHIIINGADQTASLSVDHNFYNHSLANFNTLLLGDNRYDLTAYGSQNLLHSANGYLDDVRIHRIAQSVAEVSADMAAVSPCSRDIKAFYQFDNGNWSGPGGVLDSSSNHFDGTITGNASLLLSTPQKSCKALNIPYNDSDSERDGVDTGVDVDSLGHAGTISFWYRSNQPWDSGSPRQLFDATNASTGDVGQDQVFFLALNSSGQLQFSLEDSQDLNVWILSDTHYTFAANQWVHIAVTWDMHQQLLRLYVNGELQSTHGVNQAQAGDTVGNYASLFLGDSRTNYVIANQYQSHHSANGLLDDVRIYPVEQVQWEIQRDMQSVTPCALLDHYRYTFAPQGYTCSPSTVTVSACQDSSCSTLYNQPASLDVITNGGTVDTPHVSFIGSTQLHLSKDTPGTVTLGLASASPDGPLRCYAGGSRVPCQVVFKEGGLTVSWQQTDPFTPVPDQLSQQALAENLVIDNDTNGACAANLQGEALQLAVKCTSPDSCNSNMLNLAGQTIAAPQNYLTTPYQFDANGKVIIPAGALRYDDAGQIQLLVRSANLKVSGSSNVFTVRPQLVLTTDASAIQIAGKPFNLGVSAVGQLHKITPNYRPGQLQMRLQKVLPADNQGQAGTFTVNGLGNIPTQNTSNNAFQSVVDSSWLDLSGGQAIALSSQYNEAGAIDFRLQDSNYFGYTLKSDDPFIKHRFRPAYFSVTDNQPKLEDSCSTGGFSYIGNKLRLTEAPQLTIMPKNAQGVAIHNYIGSVNRLNLNTVPAAGISLVELSDFAGVPDSDPVAPQVGFDSDGSMQLTLLDDNDAPAPLGITYPKSVTPRKPVAAELNMLFSAGYLTDSDGVCVNNDYAANPAQCLSYSITNIIGAHLRDGRLQLDNSYGPTTAPLFLVMRSQYFNSAGKWQTNNDDNCTVISAADSHLNGDVPGYNLTQTDLPPRSGTLTLKSGVSLAPLNTIQVAPPLDGKATEFPLMLDNPQYLFFDWNGDGTMQPPTGIISFGQYRGNDRIINWREVLN